MAHVSDHSHMLLAHRTAHRIHKTLAGVLCRDTSASRGAYERSYHQRVSSAVSGQSRAEDLEAHPNSIALQVSGCAPCSSRSIMEPAHSGHPPHLYSRVLPLELHFQACHLCTGIIGVEEHCPGLGPPVIQDRLLCCVSHTRWRGHCRTLCTRSLDEMQISNVSLHPDCVLA